MDTQNEIINEDTKTVEETSEETKNDDTKYVDEIKDKNSTSEDTPRL